MPMTIDAETCVELNAILGLLEARRDAECDGPAPAMFPSGIAGGSIASPSSAPDVILLREEGDGYGPASPDGPVTVLNHMARGVGTNQLALVLRRGDGGYEHVGGIFRRIAEF